MVNLENKITLPRSAFAMYVQIYCKRRDATKSKYHNILTEATKSWLSLSKMEKLHFFTKYNDCQTEYNRKFADHLKKIKPYMKKKQTFKNNREENTPTRGAESIDTGNNISVMEVDNSDNLNTSINNINNIDLTRSISERQSIMIQSEISEPTAPAVLKGEDLFNMIHERAENYNWATQSPQQRRIYRNAILAIKKKYLKEYQFYLENLPPQKLISHYKSIVNECY